MKTLLGVAVLPFFLVGCAELISIPLYIAADAAMGKSISQAKADKCYEIEVKAEKDKVSRAERNRRLSAADCPL